MTIGHLRGARLRCVRRNATSSIHICISRPGLVSGPALVHVCIIASPFETVLDNIWTAPCLTLPNTARARLRVSLSLTAKRRSFSHSLSDVRYGVESAYCSTASLYCSSRFLYDSTPEECAQSAASPSLYHLYLDYSGSPGNLSTHLSSPSKSRLVHVCRGSWTRLRVHRWKVALGRSERPSEHSPSALTLFPPESQSQDVCM